MSMTKERAGELGIALARRALLREPISFGDLESKMGRVAHELGAKHGEVQEFFIDYILPYLIAQGLCASGTIHFKYHPPKRKRGS